MKLLAPIKDKQDIVNKEYVDEIETQLQSAIDEKADINHTHTTKDITDFPTALPAKGGNADTVNNHTVDIDVPANAKFTDTDTKVTITTTNPAAATWTYPTWVTKSGTAGVNINDGLAYNTYEGTTSTIGENYLRVGNDIGEGTANNKRGTLRLCSNSAYHTDIRATPNQTGNRTILLPDASGTLSLANHTHNYLPLAGGTMTGNISVNKNDSYNLGSSDNAFGTAYINNLTAKKTSAADTYYRAYQSYSSTKDGKTYSNDHGIYFGISIAGNRGIYDKAHGWMIRAGSTTSDSTASVSQDDGKFYFGTAAMAANTTIRGQSVIRISGSNNTAIDISARKHAMIFIMSGFEYTGASASGVLSAFAAAFDYIDNTTPSSNISGHTIATSSSLVGVYSLTTAGKITVTGNLSKFEILLFD